MLLVIECMITCIIFAVIVLSTQYKDPVKYIMSYPPEIRKRVESLPEYKNSIKRTEKKTHIKETHCCLCMYYTFFSSRLFFRS